MEESKQITKKIPDIETIWIILAQEDSEKYLMRPDEDGIYTPEAFMRNLELSGKELKRQLGDYCELVKIKIEKQLAPDEKTSKYVEPCTFPKNQPTDAAKVMFMLAFSVKPQEAADVRRVEGAIWILQQMYSMTTGANLFNSSIEPHRVFDPNKLPTDPRMVAETITYPKIQTIKKKVRKALRKGKVKTLTHRFEKQGKHKK